MSSKLTIPQACYELRKTYPQVLRLVTLRQLRGGRDNGKWWVDAQDVARYQRENNAPGTPQAA